MSSSLAADAIQLGELALNSGITIGEAIKKADASGLADSILDNLGAMATTAVCIYSPDLATVVGDGIAAGQRVFGENRVQEALAKWPALREGHPGLELHLIGPLQSNKAREAVGLFDAIHSIDRPSVCRTVAKEIERAWPPLLDHSRSIAPNSTSASPSVATACTSGPRPARAGRRALMLRLGADENSNDAVVRGVLLRRPNTDLVRVRDAGLSEADDPTILEWAARADRALLTHDVATMTRHAYERVEAGLPMPGVFEVGRKVAIGEAIDEILLLVDVHLDELHRAVRFRHHLLDDRTKRFARPAPRRPEIHDHRNVAARFQNVGGECLQPAVLDVRAVMRGGCGGRAGNGSAAGSDQCHVLNSSGPKDGGSPV